MSSGCVRRYIDLLLIPTPLVSALFCSILMFSVLVPVHFCNLFKRVFAQYKQTYGQLRVSHGSCMKGCT